MHASAQRISTSTSSATFPNRFHKTNLKKSSLLEVVVARGYKAATTAKESRNNFIRQLLLNTNKKEGLKHVCCWAPVAVVFNCQNMRKLIKNKTESSTSISLRSNPRHRSAHTWSTPPRSTTFNNNLNDSIYTRIRHLQEDICPLFCSINAARLDWRLIYRRRNTTALANNTDMVRNRNSHDKPSQYTSRMDQLHNCICNNAGNKGHK